VKDVIPRELEDPRDDGRKNVGSFNDGEDCVYFTVENDGKKTDKGVTSKTKRRDKSSCGGYLSYNAWVLKFNILMNKELGENGYVRNKSF